MAMVPGRRAVTYLFTILLFLVAASENVRGMGVPIGGPAHSKAVSSKQTSREGVAEAKEQTGMLLQVPAGIRVLVFSPHPDDETLAAGGLIQRVLEKGGKVRVVIVTNGDAYAKGVSLLTGHSRIFTQDYVSYGVKRHGEALRAVSYLGLKSRDVEFLGFPDQGIDTIRDFHPTPGAPYTSPYTSYDHPYKCTSRKPVKYDGADLEAEMDQTIRDFAPDWVLLPDPRDQHSDHSGTGIFVLAALDRLGRKDTKALANTRVLTYLVHYPGYPESKGWIDRVDRIVPGAPESNVLSSTKWIQMHLTPKEVSTKRGALAFYRSQLQVMGGLMKKFIRSGEMFGSLNASQILDAVRIYNDRGKLFP